MKNTDRTQIHTKVKDWKKKSHTKVLCYISLQIILYFTIKLADYHWKISSVILFIVCKCCFTCRVSCCWMWKAS